MRAFFAIVVAACLLVAPLLPKKAVSATANANLAVTITIENECEIAAPNPLAFGTHGVLSANVDVTAVFTVTCTTDHPYALSMGAGLHGTLADREMSNTAETASVHYQIYTTTDRDVVWNAVAVIEGTGTGAAVEHTAYGRVPSQATPIADSYSDTVQITVTY